MAQTPANEAHTLINEKGIIEAVNYVNKKIIECKHIEVNYWKNVLDILHKVW